MGGASKVWQASGSRTRVTRIQGFFLLAIKFPVIPSRRAFERDTKFQMHGNVDKKTAGNPEVSNFSRLNSGGAVSTHCTVCGRSFDLPAGSRREVCSVECKAERNRQYSQSYRAEGKRMKDELLSHFGGQMPSTADFQKLIQQRKAQR